MAPLLIIDTATAADLAGPRITGHTPAVVTSNGGPLNKVRLTFDEPVAPTSFTSKDATLYGPMGALLPVTVSAVAGSGDTQFDLVFADQTLRGSYLLTVGPNITDVAGNPMNQDGDASNGEGADAYKGIITFEATVPALGSAPHLFSEDFESWLPVPSHWSFSPAGTLAAVTSDSPKAGLQHLRLNATNYNESQWAVLKLDLSEHAGATDLFLEFWAKLTATASGQLYVEVSGDGINWQQILSTDPPSTYQNYVIDLDAELATGSIALDADVYIRFRNIQTTSSSSYYYRVFLDDVRMTRGSPMLLLSVTPTAFPENAGPAATYGTIKRINSTNLTDSVVVMLTEPTGAVVLPTSVTIPVNATETTFLIGAQDDGVIVGNRQTTITATATGFSDGVTTVTLLEATAAQIRLLVLGTTVSEAAGANALSAIVTRDRGLDTNLVVNLNSSDTTELTTPLSVTIPAGSLAAAFTISTHNDGDLDGTKTVTLTATATTYAASAVSVDVLDDDTVDNRTLGGIIEGTLGAASYLVSETVIIKAGSTLTVPPGATLRFTDGSKVQVSGRLIADGGSGQSIRFISAAETPAPGDWGGIEYLASGQSQSLLNQVEIAYATTGLRIIPNGADPNLVLSQSTVQSNSLYGVTIYAGEGEFFTSTEVQLRNNHILANGNGGIFLSTFALGC